MSIFQEAILITWSVIPHVFFFLNYIFVNNLNLNTYAIFLPWKNTGLT